MPQYPSTRQELYFKHTQNAHDQQESVFFLRPEQIRVPNAGKKAQNHNAIIRIADAIRKYGVVEPLEVRIVRENGNLHYELIGNEVAWHAARLAGVEQIPCTAPPIHDKASEIEYIFNKILQKRLHLFDQARAFRALLEEYGLTQGEIARKLGISQSAVANKLRLLQYSAEEMREFLRLGLSERHARAILRLKTPHERMDAMRIIAKEQMNVCDAEAWIEQHSVAITVPEEHAFETPNADITQPKDEFGAILTPNSSVLPRKFALQSLQPLYNSVDRALNIFRKTGYQAEMYCEEDEGEVCITIKIPTRS